MADLRSITSAVIEGDSRGVQKLVEESLAAGVSPLVIFQEALIPGMDVVGQKMKANEYYIPEVLMAAKAMKAAAGILKPLIVQSGGHQPAGRVVIGTVNGDLHDIGKNLVAMMLEGAGFEVTDLGVDVPARKFVRVVQETQADLLGLSAMLTTTMLRMKDVMGELEVAGCRDTVRVMIGGAPVNQRFADEIGADGYGADATTAAEMAKAWMAARKKTVTA